MAEHNLDKITLRTAFIRCLARILDLWIFFFLIINIVYLYQYYTNPLYTANLTHLFDFSVALFWCLLFEPLFLTYYGYTLGKYLLRVQVQTSDSNKLSYSQNLTRGWWVFVIGLGCGIIPFITVLIFWLLILRGSAVTYWDRKAGSIVRVGKNTGLIRALLIFIIAFVLSSSLIIFFGVAVIHVFPK